MSEDNAKYEMERILAASDKGISETRGIGGILARLWRTILFDRGVKSSLFEMLLTDFINSARKKIPDNRVSKLFTRGNLRRELERPTMTFKVLMKGIKLLKVVKLTVAVELEFANGSKSLHQTSVDLGDNHPTNDIYNMDNEE